ncbi:MAG: bifunctional demethylmenaquinone methyltransferase/2-methoxy-6-polyprenyl-1,4-benzoquinol methylase UbiE [Prevotellaceae bacterium]|jgi:demethylmenaquinone methyltransferase/2-methoxy-6-polyprenyl-1,4-benzoquinol methylase|nr:bifunctional demethylmenaquinone methyltransferase/2-methoxy-6-polyprenyl-1,4-benzoquinol methylase UbiE [Prevotellaceae bacterium]
MEKNKVAEMFNNIASGYDFLNRTLSLGIDKIWRRKLRKKLDAFDPAVILDIATGTADLAIECAKSKKHTSRKITGIDISEKMLEKGREKIEKKHLDDRIVLQYGDSENMEFDSNTFDAVVVGFGVRNFENLEKGLKEIYRVTKHSGKVFILDFSMPRNPFIRIFYEFYFFRILPFIGKTISGDNYAYKYLPESVCRFPQYEQMTGLMNNAGFVNTEYQSLTFGIAVIYSGAKMVDYLQ